MTEIKRITAGNSAAWTKVLPNYKAIDGWTLHYSIVNQTNQYTVSATANGDDYDVTIDAVVSATWAPGRYRLYGYVTKGVERITVFKSSFIVSPDFLAPGDHRRYAERVLEAVEAVIAKTATKDQQQLTVDGQTIARRNIPDLLVLRDRMKREVRHQKQAARAKKLGRLPGRVLVRNS